MFKTLKLWAMLACFAALAPNVLNAQTFLIGDVNQDEFINFEDISAFINVLSSREFQPEADIDGNLVVDFLDIGPFISLMNTQSVPVSTPADLQRIHTSPNNNFHLTKDIDLAAIADFDPLGTASDPFTGTFEGNGYTIRNLTINAAPQSKFLQVDDSFFLESFVGLFAVTDHDATIQNVNLTDVSVYGELMVGALVGQCRSSTITACTASGVVGGLRQVGGLIGFLGDSDVAHCSANVNVEYCEVILTDHIFGPTAAPSFWFGGLVGHAHPYRLPGREPTHTGDGSTLFSCFAVGDVYGSFIAGGLVGNLHGSSADNCFAIGNVETEYAFAGGLIGYMQVERGVEPVSPQPILTICTNSGAVGDVTCNQFGLPGGFAGLPLIGPPVIPPLQSRGAGGFVGFCQGALGEIDSSLVPLSDIQDCFAEGDVTSLEPNRKLPISTGGFVGFTELFTLISDCHSSGEVLNIRGGQTGGFVGWAEGVIEDSESTGNVIAGDRSGGFAGQVASTRLGTGSQTGPFRGQFLGCVSYGNVQSNNVARLGGDEVLAIGGFVGYSFGGVEFENCESHGTATAISRVSGFIGGFIGHASDDTITECSSWGDVFTGFGEAGGFIGGQRLKDGFYVTDCFSRGDVVYTGFGTPRLIGGFVGNTDHNTNIDRCYSTGNVNETGNSVGGFVGSSVNISFSDCYWDTTTAGQSTGSQPFGVNGRTTAQLQQQSTFVGWDFANIWDIAENVSYPFFR